MMQKLNTELCHKRLNQVKTNNKIHNQFKMTFFTYFLLEFKRNITATFYTVFGFCQLTHQWWNERWIMCEKRQGLGPSAAWSSPPGFWFSVRSAFGPDPPLLLWTLTKAASCSMRRHCSLKGQRWHNFSLTQLDLTLDDDAPCCPSGATTAAGIRSTELSVLFYTF